MSTLFISDLHLAPTRPARVQEFQRFLRGPARDAEALYVLGDLVDAWLGDDVLAVDRFAQDVAAEFRALSDAGVQLFLQHGNRDFLLREGFAHAVGATLLPEYAIIDLYDTPTLILHGDQLCTDDWAYQEFRRQVRAVAFQDDFLALPLAQRIERARALREASDAAKAEKSMAIMDANADAIAQAFRRHGVRRMIHGHTHRPAHHTHHIDGVRRDRYVLADWYERASYLACDHAGCEAHVLPAASHDLPSLDK